VCFVALIGGAAVWFAFQDQARFSGDRLEQFEGRISHERVTFDPVKSELATRAAQALKRGDAAEAERVYRQTVERYPNDASCYTDLGACLFFQEKYAEARQEYLRALELNPHSADARYGLGCVDYKENRFPEARDQLLQALAIHEADAATHRVLTLVYLELREPDKARTHFDRAGTLDPTIAADESIRQRLAGPAVR
jgi:tetratricopeptide (TPR) repeat protein